MTFFHPLFLSFSFLFLLFFFFFFFFSFFFSFFFFSFFFFFSLLFFFFFFSWYMSLLKHLFCVCQWATYLLHENICYYLSHSRSVLKKQMFVFLLVFCLFLFLFFHLSICLCYKEQISIPEMFCLAWNIWGYVSLLHTCTFDAVVHYWMDVTMKWDIRWVLFSNMLDISRLSLWGVSQLLL